MKTIKKFIPIAIVSLFLLGAFIPAVSASENTFEIMYTDEGQEYKKVVELTPDQKVAIEAKFTDWETTVGNFNADGKMSLEELATFKTITEEFLNEIKDVVGEDVFASFIPVPTLMMLLTGNLPWGTHIFSIGRGWVQMPFSNAPILGRIFPWLVRPNEKFFGLRVLPIIMHYSLGYTKIRKNYFPVYIGVEDRFIHYTARITGFYGLYINIGDLYLDTMKGPVILIGRSFMQTRLGEDIP